jgi:hypothetical protein
MIDRHIEKMIATLKEKASHEKESLTKMLSDCKQQLKNAKAIEKKEEKVRQSRIQYDYIAMHVHTSSCMFQSADQHQSHLLTWGYISQRRILVTEQLTLIVGNLQLTLLRLLSTNHTWVKCQRNRSY